MAEVIVIHGYAGSGKTTQCERIVGEGLGGAVIQHISLGNKLRAIKNNTTHSKHSNYINSPLATSPLPHEVVNDVVFECIDPENYNLILIDGYPHYSDAVEVFHGSLEQSRLRLLGTVVLEITFATSKERITTRGLREGEPLKSPDLESHILERFTRDSERSTKAIAELSTLAPVIRVAADGDKDTVHRHFKNALGQLVLGCVGK